MIEGEHLVSVLATNVKHLARERERRDRERERERERDREMVYLRSISLWPITKGL